MVKVSYMLYVFALFLILYVSWSSALPMLSGILGEKGEGPSDLRKLLLLGTAAGLLTKAG